ncbi:MAG: DUF3791 domain-containing protein [Treponema sp.]|nr:DUF3791 domain-containing protein [Treponema sp.]
MRWPATPPFQSGLGSICIRWLQKGVLSYLADNAEILHTQGKNYILDSIDDYIKNYPLSI